MMTLGGGRAIITLRAVDRDRGRWSCEVIVGSDLSLYLVLSLCRWWNVGHGRLFVITCKTCLLQSMTRTIIFGWLMLVIRMYLWKPSGCIMLISVFWTSLRQSGYERRVTCNACHVSPWGAWHVFSGWGVPTVPILHIHQTWSPQCTHPFNSSLSQPSTYTQPSTRSPCHLSHPPYLHGMHDIF